LHGCLASRFRLHYAGTGDNETGESRFQRRLKRTGTDPARDRWFGDSGETLIYGRRRRQRKPVFPMASHPRLSPRLPVARWTTQNRAEMKAIFAGSTARTICPEKGLAVSDGSSLLTRSRYIQQRAQDQHMGQG
jgi:hypothetical protein